MFYTFSKASHQLAEINTIRATSDDPVSAVVKHLSPASHTENFELSWDVVAFSKPQCISAV